MDATGFLKSGIAVIPVLPGTKKPFVRWRRYEKQLPTERDLVRWFAPGRAMNAAVICGWQGLTVLDFDDMQRYVVWLAWAVATGGTARAAAQDTYRVRTSRGIHVYLLVDDCPRCGHFQWGDIKGRGGYVLIPPSVHPSGAVYTAVDDVAPMLRVTVLAEVIPDAPAPPLLPPLPLTAVTPMSSLWPATRAEEVKAAVPILSFFPDARPTGGGGRWLMAHCPWHDDKHESLWIDTEKGICKCYAGCTLKPLDVIGVHARLQGISDRQALRELHARITC
jgi:hypothetical protein